MERNKVTVGAFAIIKDKYGSFLLCFRNDKKVWNLPGGQVDNNEAPWDTVIREVKEEVNLDITINKLVAVYSKSDINDISFYFDCSVKSGTPKTSDEAEEIQYFSIDELPKDIVLQHMVALNDVSEKKGEIVTKTQLQRLFKDLDGNEMYYDKL